ncbi:MAG: glycoside hydrolase family 3 protein [Marinilabiliaceae bacterium]|nr:glycoside hydrolase family 3 protein [Marinilabiliaceae bacterium]
MYSKPKETESLYPTDVYQIGAQWADSIYNILTEEERIAQLFWIAIENPDNKVAFDRYKKLIENNQPGGIILFRMTPQKAQEVIAEYQSISKIPLIVSIDGENGVAMRFSGVVEFPKAMTLGAIRDDSLIYAMGLEIARQCKIMGIHANLAPVADINSNPKNPVIGVRSYGDNPKNVARKASAYMQGLQDGGVMAVAKHFPGHGDTDTDSHKTLPQINHNRARLDSVELFPFKTLANEGIWGIMSSHLEVPALEPKTNIPATFSSNIMKNILKNEFNFTGLVISDAVNMKGAKIMGKPGEVDALALAAGNDIILFTENLPEAINKVKEFINDKKITAQEIEDKCKRSLAFKYFLTQNDTIKIAPEKLLSELNSPEAKKLNRQLYEAAVKVISNKNNVIPIKDNSEKWGCFIIGDISNFEKIINQQPNIELFKLPLNNDANFQEVFKKAKNYTNIIFVVADESWGRNTANNSKKQQIYDIAKSSKSIFVFMGNVYRFSNWRTYNIFDGTLVVYQKTPEAQEAMVKRLIKK